MLKKIKQLIVDFQGHDITDEALFHEKHLASAALMVEAATLDGVFDESERAAILELIQRAFELNAEDAEALINEAISHHSESTHLLRFTRAVKDHFDEEERIELVEMMWGVVYADGVLHDYEANLMRRIAGLIYVSDRDSGDARKRVMADLGI